MRFRPFFVAGLILSGALSIFLPSMPAGGVAGFGDVAEERFFTKPIQWLVDNEITTGTSPTCFSPDDGVTRGQAAAFMWRMEGRPPAGPGHDFVDVVKGWQQDPVSWMSRNRITTGTSPTTYSPERTLTRGEMAALVWRLAGRPSGSPPHRFTDVVKPWQQEAVSWMSDTGVTTGTSPNTYEPDRIVTRGELATFLYRYSGSPSVKVDRSHPTDPACAGQVPGPPGTVPPPTVPPVTTSVPVDGTPPTAPGALTAAPLACANDLSWSSAADPESGIESYTVRRGTTSGGAKAPIATVASSLVSYRDTAVVGGTPYFYEVAATNGAGLAGSPTNESTSTAAGESATPTSPGALTSLSGIGTAVLSWDGATPSITEYTIYRGTTLGGPGTPIATVPSSYRSYVDEAVTVGTTYYYRVTASNCSAVEGPATNEVGITVASNLNDATLAAGWLFEEGAGASAADVSVNGNDLTLVGSPDWVAGTVGSGLRFESEDRDAGFVPHSPSLDFGSDGFSVALWVRHQAAVDADIIRKGSIGTASSYWKLELPTVRNRFSFEVFAANGPANVRAPQSYGDGQWHSVVAVRDVGAGLLRLYVDGVEVATGADPGGSVSNLAGLSIGSKDSLDDDFFDGSVDSVRLYGRAISPKEVAALYALGD